MLNSNLDDRTAVADLFEIANNGLSSRRIVRYNHATLNTPYKAGITFGIDSGVAIISVSSSNNYGIILCLPDGGVQTTLYICKKTNSTWGKWESLATNSLNGVKLFCSLNQIPTDSELTDLKSIVKALPDNSIFIGGTDFEDLTGSMLADVNGKYPSAGLIEIVKFRRYRNTIRVSRSTDGFTGNNIIYETRYISSTDSIAPWSVLTMTPMT